MTSEKTNARKTKKLAVKILLFLIVYQTSGYAQNQGNVWYFPRGLGLDFNYSPPQVLVNGEIDSNGGGTEGCSSIATRNGNLLFYANGEYIWNRKHEIMKNGDELMGHFSSTNGALIIPMPGENNKYYVFTTHAWHESLLHGLRYSIVDMCGDNGYGEVISNAKNIPLLSDAGEKLAFTKHANGKNYWLVAHRHFSSAFYAYLISENGISTEVISEIGTYHGRDGYKDGIGQMKISPEGNKLALVNENRIPDVIDLFAFNNSTGMVTDYINLSDQSESGGLYGVAFSPDQTKLYVSGRDGVFQFSLDAGSGNQNEIIQSKYKLAEQVTTGGLQLGPDGKIYLVRFSHAAIINSPNMPGAACNFVDNAIYLEDRIVTFAFPSFLDSFEYPDKGLIPLEVNLRDHLLLCPGSPISIDATSKGENVKYLWEDGSVNPVYTTSSAGKYTVKISDRFCKVEKTIVVESQTFNDLGSDQIVCEHDTIILTATVPGATYSWHNDSTHPSLIADHSGIYWIDVTKDNCTVRDSVTLVFSDSPKFSLGSDTTLCEGQEIKLVINAQADKYEWQDGTEGSEYIVKAPGHYWATSTLKDCAYKDSINVTYKTLPKLSIGTDTLLCEGSPLVLAANVDNSTLRWNNGSSGMTLPITESGAYWLDLFIGNCSVRDSVIVEFSACSLEMPNIFTPNGDEFNSNFIPLKLKGVRSGNLVIYNRWGQEIFQTTDLTTGWDGDSEDSSTGVYFWRIQYTDIANITHTLKGSVTLNK